MNVTGLPTRTFVMLVSLNKSVKFSDESARVILGFTLNISAAMNARLTPLTSGSE